MVAPSASICTWQDLSYTDSMYLLDGRVQKVDIQRQLTKILGQLDNEERSRSDPEMEKDSLQDKRFLIVLDLFHNLVTFARQHGLRPDQLSGLFSIVRCIHAHCISSPYDNSRECFDYFTVLMVCHSVDRPPYSTSLFTMDQVKLISDYVLRTYFKHFKLYKYAFTKRVTLSMKLVYDGMEEEEEKEEEAEEEEKEETLSQVEDAEKEEVDGEEGEKSTAEEEKLTPEQQRLQEMISASLNDHLKQLQVSVEKEITSSDKRIMEKLSTLDKGSRANSASRGSRANSASRSKKGKK